MNASGVNVNRRVLVEFSRKGGQAPRLYCGVFVAALAVLASGCTEYIGVARAPSLPLPPAPVEQPVHVTRTADGVALTLDEWNKVIDNTKELRLWIEKTRGMVEVYNKWVEENKRKEAGEGHDE